MDVDTAKKYLLRRISPGASYDELLRFPTYFEIETVNACNARCPMCTIDDWTRKTPIMKDDLFLKISDELCEHADEIRRVSLYRDGEPLLDKKLAWRTHQLKKGGVKRVGISTNVSLLNPTRSVELLEAGLDEIVLSIDSLKKEVFEAIRLRLSFDEVLENALRFVDLRDQIRPETTIWMRMIRQASNDAEWPEYEAFWRPRLAQHDRVYSLNIHNWGDQLSDFQAIHESPQPRLPCVALWSLMVIFANGDVPLCNVDYNNRYPTGNVRDTSIGDLWKSRVIDSRRDLHLGGRKASISLCENCTVWDEPGDGESVTDAFLRP
jgi:MoaA/NifB/PqqE/SkfB family radical SAM enzyme